MPHRTVGYTLYSWMLSELWIAWIVLIIDWWHIFPGRRFMGRTSSKFTSRRSGNYFIHRLSWTSFIETLFNLTEMSHLARMCFTHVMFQNHMWIFRIQCDYFHMWNTCSIDMCVTREVSIVRSHMWLLSTCDCFFHVTAFPVWIFTCEIFTCEIPHLNIWFTCEISHVKIHVFNMFYHMWSSNNTRETSIFTDVSHGLQICITCFFTWVLVHDCRPGSRLGEVDLSRLGPSKSSRVGFICLRRRFPRAQSVLCQVVLQNKSALKFEERSRTPLHIRRHISIFNDIWIVIFAYSITILPNIKNFELITVG